MGLVGFGTNNISFVTLVKGVLTTWGVRQQLELLRTALTTGAAETAQPWKGSFSDCSGVRPGTASAGKGILTLPESQDIPGMMV